MQIASQSQKSLKAALPPLSLVPPPNTSATAVNAQIPIIPTDGYEPVYLSDSDIVNMDRVKRGGVIPSHDAVEADKVGTR